MRLISDKVEPSSPYSKADPQAMPPAVWLTAGGECFHSARGCLALASGQHNAQAAGYTPHERRLVSLEAAQNASARPCRHCFPAHINAHAERCLVKVGDFWEDGFIILRCKIYGIPHCLVDYRHDDRRQEIGVTEEQIRFSLDLAC